MNLNVSSEKLKEQLKDNQELLIVVAVLGAAILLFIILILPSVLGFPSKFGERNTEIEDLNKIKAAKSVLESADATTLEAELDTATKALPSDRNYELILGAISEAATRSNSIITAYTYKSTPNVTEVRQGEFPGLIFEIDIAGGVGLAAGFIDQLSNTYPISEVKEVNYDGDISTVTVAFYYKPFTEVKAEDVTLAREKTEDEKKALEEVSGWNLFTPDFGFIQQISSESASPF